MPNIDIPLPDRLTEALENPPCVELRLPKPGKVDLHLPTGGSIKGIVDATKAIPDDCSLTFSLAIQLGPFLASIECLMKLMGLIKPLIDVVKGLGPPPDLLKLGSAIPEFIKAAEQVMPCVLQLTGLGFFPFVKDLLCLIIKILKCVVGQLKSIAALMSGLSLQIQAAQGNQALLEQLQCAQENASLCASQVMSGIEPVMFLLSLAEPMLGVVGVNPIQTPPLGTPDSAEALNGIIVTLDTLVQALETAAEVVGGC